MDLVCDGQATPEEERAFGEHTAACGECRREYESLRSLLDELAGGNVPIPEGLHQRIMSAVANAGAEEEERGAHSFFSSFRFMRVAPAAAVFLIICAVALKFFPSAFLPEGAKEPNPGAALNGNEMLELTASEPGINMDFDGTYAPSFESGSNYVFSSAPDTQSKGYTELTSMLYHNGIIVTDDPAAYISDDGTVAELCRNAYNCGVSVYFEYQSAEAFDDAASALGAEVESNRGYITLTAGQLEEYLQNRRYPIETAVAVVNAELGADDKNSLQPELLPEAPQASYGNEPANEDQNGSGGDTKALMDYSEVPIEVIIKKP